jgi:hypothetical protein
MRGRAAEREQAAFRAARLEGLRSFVALLDAGIAAFTQGQPLSPETLRKAPLHAVPKPR